MSKEDKAPADPNTGDRFTPPNLTMEMACRSEKITAFIWKRLSYFPFTKHEAEDVAQNVEHALVTGFATFRPTEPFRPWLSTIVDREARRYLKKQKQYNAPLTREQSLFDELPDLAPVADDAFVQKQRAAFVRATIEAMRPPVRELGTLYLSGLSVEQCAKVLHIPPGTAWSRFDEIKQNVKQAEEQRRRKEAPFGVFAFPWVTEALFGSDPALGSTAPPTLYQRTWTSLKEHASALGVFGAGTLAGGLAMYLLLSSQTAPSPVVATGPSVQVEAVSNLTPGALPPSATNTPAEGPTGARVPDHAPLAMARAPGAQTRAPRDLARETLDAAGAGAERGNAAEVRALVGRSTSPGTK
jgi:RNA polymerase sigma factor (sigma-70 family)